MLKEYSQEELWNLYDKLPEELREALFSETVATAIHNICERNEIENTLRLTKLIGFVLLGILLPEKLQMTLHEELNLSVETSEKVSQEINRFIFYPVKDNLSALYGKEISPVPPKSGETISPEEKPISERATPPRKDTYRESIGEE